jgi:DNA-binding response OmpR family regulator
MESDMMQKSDTRVVLLVEDSPTQSISVKTLLEREGVRCILASDGQTGLYLAQSLLPDVIILDLEMPQMNGFQVCRLLKADDKTAEIPIILMTRHDEASTVVQGLELGAIEFIPKDTFADAVLLETLRYMEVIRRNPS